RSWPRFPIPPWLAWPRTTPACASLDGGHRLGGMAEAFREQYAALFGRPWSVGTAAILVAASNVLRFAFDRRWTASDGVRNWGDWFFTGLGLVRRPDLVAPWLYSGSVIDLGVIAGALSAALLAREFAIRVPRPGELVKGGL